MQPRPHLARRMTGASAQVSVAAKLLIADAVGTEQRGRRPHAGEELPQVRGAPAPPDGPGRDRHHGGGVRGCRPPLLEVLCPLTASGKPATPAQHVDGAGPALPKSRRPPCCPERSAMLPTWSTTALICCSQPCSDLREVLTRLARTIFPHTRGKSSWLTAERRKAGSQPRDYVALARSQAADTDPLRPARVTRAAGHHWPPR
jgi:hypothetical protein